MPQTYRGDSTGLVNRIHPEQNTIVWQKEDQVCVDINESVYQQEPPLSPRDRTCLSITGVGVASCLLAMFLLGTCPPFAIGAAILGGIAVLGGGLAFAISRDNQ